MRNPYNPADWYWIVGGDGPHRADAQSGFTGDDKRVYSSARKRYVPVTDKAFLQWRERLMDAAGGVEPTTRIDSEQNLADVLAARGLSFEPRT